MIKNSATSSDQKEILLVDDEEQVLFVISESLRKLGPQTKITTAPSGEKALELFRKNSFDLVITDLKMPGLNGVELTKAIRAVDPDMNIVWMTAFGTEAVESEARKLNIKHFLAKPLDISDIRQIARNALEKTIHSQKEERFSEIPLIEDLRELMDQLQVDTGAYAVLLTTSTGNPIETTGITKDLDVTTLSALVAGNFMAAHEITQMLGRESNFKLSYHESDQHNIYAYGVGEKYLLIIVFGSEIRTGVVFYFTQRAVGDFERILEEMDAVDKAETILNPAFLEEAETELDNFLENIWAEEPDEPDEEIQKNLFATIEQPIKRINTGSLLSFEDAISKGVIENDISGSGDPEGFSN